MFAKERQETIIDLLKRNKSVKVSQLTKRFQVSLETIRRDLEFLEKEGLIKRVHGGAVLEETTSHETTFIERETIHIEEKKEIAKIATRFVTEGQSIALDVSTTNTEFAKVLKETFSRLTVVTNSLPIANILAEMPNYTIILPGGVLRNQELCIVGEMAEAFVSQFHIDTFFMSMSGISLSAGLTDYGIGEVQMKSKMLQASQKGIVLADSSKFDVKSFLKVCDLERVEYIITDSKLKQSIVEKYEKAGIEIINK
ncbi:DeoR/GlpR family DNA-binding transcription regulator [Alkalihalobacterium bogoriense]|uniref:DeoR/GlpR family DNA-binding transcription regulator n=1 Tax=Alkalihalobacterium bogoriense TaxID=246272 RepID=UPI00047CE7B4|nr:DeoR/GlpR family DNA-binding transcription regulator [Alkalihalobacterium bogoriense]